MKTTTPSTKFIPCGNLPPNSILPQLGRIFQEMTFRSMRKWKLPPNVTMVLGYLQMHPDICEPAAIAEAKRLPRQTVTFILDTLEKRNLASRKPHPHDRRKKMVLLTAKGTRLANNIIQDFLQIEKATAAAIGKADLETVRNILGNFGEIIDDINSREFNTVKG
jgi:DNA-binding MarR family transcriptional regulator